MSLGRWVVVVVIGGYLSYETGRHRLLGVAVPVLGWGVVLPLLAGLYALHRRGIRRRTVLQVSAAVALVAVAAPIVFVAVAHGAHGRLDHLERILTDDGAQLASRLVDARLFGGTVVLPIVAAVLALVIGGAIGTRRLALPTALEVLVLVAVTWFVLEDVVLFESPGLRDLRLDLVAGSEFTRGGQVYLDALLVRPSADPTLLPFLYPPYVLPFFGLLAPLPFPMVAVAWLAGSMGAAVASLRLFGLSWRWAGLLLLWPAFAEGIYVGNVAVPALLLFAVGPWLGAGLVLNAAFKLQSGVPALWLVRERRWRALVIGIGGLAAIVAVTLPLTGLGRWAEWLRGLQLYEASQSFLPTLYGFALPGIVPYPIYLLLAGLAIAAALAVPGRESLARFGVATVVASPSLFTHGFLVALPALLQLRSLWFWAALALTSTVLGPGWWIAVGIGVGAWLVPALRRDTAAMERLHPLGVALEPWPQWTLRAPKLVGGAEPAVDARTSGL